MWIRHAEDANGEFMATRSGWRRTHAPPVLSPGGPAGPVLEPGRLAPAGGGSSSPHGLPPTRARGGSRSFSARSESEEADKVRLGERSEADLEGRKVDEAVRVWSTAQRRDAQAAGVFRASVCVTRSRSLASGVEKASRKSLHTSRMAQRPASVRIGATIALPVVRPPR